MIRTLVFSAAMLATTSAYADPLVVYSARKEEMLKPLTDMFTKETGIEVKILSDETPKLIARLESEGKDSPADVLMPVDVANMTIASDKKLLKPVVSKTLEKNIPANLRAADGSWFGLGKRARIIVYNKEKVKPSELSTYEQLASDKWKGQVLVRSSAHAYNQSLMAAMIETGGAEKTQEWANGIAANLTRQPQGGDKDQIKAVAAGEGLVTLANSYYYARMLTSELPEEKEAAEKTAVFFPNQKSGKSELNGTHVNISGAGVVATTDMEKEAVQFIEFLSGAEAQKFYADSNQEYPVNPKVKPSEILQGLGNFKADKTPLSSLGQHAKEAIMIADRSGWK